MDLSIIILSYNTKQLLKKCLDSIFAQTNNNLSFEVIVVDNNSTDGSIECVQKDFPQVKLIQNKENVGFGRANNQAMKEAKGEWVLFFNSDCEVLDNATYKLLTFAKDKGENSIYGGKLYNVDKTPQASAGKFYTLPVVVSSLFLKGDQLQITRSSPDTSTESDWVSGACLLMHKRVYEKVQGFDETIFMYMDEVDLCYRAKKLGIKTLFYPEAHFIHVGSASSGDKREPYINMFSGLLYFYKKHWPDKLPYLKVLLKIKGQTAMFVGKLLNNQSLIENYKKALMKLD